jgi:uncharacterized protein involved in exopolysaccharide biosynthesis
VKTDSVGQFEFNFGEYLKIIPRRKWFILLPMAIIGSMVIFAGFITPNKYSARSVLMIQEEAMENPLFKGLVYPSSVANRMSIIHEVIFSPNSMKKAAAVILADSVMGNRLSRDQIYESIKNNVLVNIVTKSKSYGTQDLVVEFSCIGSDSVAVALIVDAVVNVFIEESLYQQQNAARSAIHFMEKQVASYKNDLELADTNLSEFKETNVLALPGAMDFNVRKVSELEAELVDAEIRLAEIERQQQHLADMLTVNNKTLVDKRSELADLMTRYTEKHPRILQLRQELEFLETQLLKEREKLLSGESFDYNLIVGKQHRFLDFAQFKQIFDSGTNPAGEPPAGELAGQTQNSQSGSPILLNPDQLDQLTNFDPYLALVFTDLAKFKELEIQKKTLLTRKWELKKQHERFMRQLKSIPDQEQHLLLLNRDYEVLKQIYETLYTKLENARLSQTLALTNELARYRILQKAEVPKKPMESKKTMIIIAGIMGGIFLGLGLAIFVEFSDTNIKTDKDVARYLGLKNLVNLPNLNENR